MTAGELMQLPATLARHASAWRKEEVSQVQNRLASSLDAPEKAGYFELPGADLYTVLHEVANPSARVLLVGAFASERHSSYIPWVRWARYLAERGIECLRYDYRGVGESTGVFENLSFDDWSEDVELLAGWLQSRSPEVPLVLHGLELGALLANKAFSAGIGDGLLAWAAPNSADEVLRAALLRRIAMDNMFRYGDRRRRLPDYLQQLETEHLEVDGYRWSAKLWQDSFNLELPAGMKDGGTSVSGNERPVRTVSLDKSAEPLVKGSMYKSINPDLNGLFADNFKWIATAAASREGRNDLSY